MDEIRIRCPGASLPEKERISGLLDSCFLWACSQPVRDLAKLFGADLPVCRQKQDRTEYIEKLHEFVKRWDYRNGRERWAIGDDPVAADNSEYVMEKVKALGLVDTAPPLFEPDHIIPLGGAGRSNSARCLMAKKVIDRYGYSGKKITALSGTRPINEVERTYIDEYAKGAKTEFEAICAALEGVFGLGTYKERTESDDNINLCSAIRKYDGKYKDSEVYSLAAPSSDPARRADSYDTFNFMLKQFSIGQGEKLLLVTSTIYVPFQYLKFMKQAICGGFDVDCIGTDIAGSMPHAKPTGYLQEIKSTVDAIYGLYFEDKRPER